MVVPTRQLRRGGSEPRPHLSARCRLAIALTVLPLGLAACSETKKEPGEDPIRIPPVVSSVAPPLPGLPIKPDETMTWTHARAARAAWYGPADAPALLAIACEGRGKRAARLVIVRYAPTDKGSQALFAIQGSKGILRLPVSAVKIGKEGHVWRGVLGAGDPRAEVLLGNGLKATVPGGGELHLAPMGAAGAVVTECAAAAAQTLPNRASNPATSPVAR